jgi:hypothetical protein
VTESLKHTSSISRSVVTQVDFIVTNDRISYVTSNGDTKSNYYSRSTSSRSVAEQIGSILSEHKNAKARIALLESPYTIIPSDLFDEKNALLYFRENIANHENYIVQTEDVMNQRVKLIYGLQPEQFESWPHLDRIEFYHYLTPLINYTDTAQEGLHAFYLNEYLVLLGISNHRLSLTKIIPIKSDDEVLYHILNGFSTCHLNTHDHPLILSGRFERESALFSSLYQFIDTIHLPSVPGLNQLDSHIFYDMFLMSKHIQ